MRLLRILVPLSLGLVSGCKIYCMAVGPQGQVISSSDEGRTWIAGTPPYQHVLHGVASIGSTSWVVAGENGRVYRTSNAGQTWTKLFDNGVVGWRDIAIDGRHIVVVGESGHILHSGDRGSTWQFPTSHTLIRLTGVSGVGSGRLVAATALGHILRSSDHGVTWDLANVQLPLQLEDIAVSATGRVVAVGRLHASNPLTQLMRSVDGGVTWTDPGLNPVTRWSQWREGSGPTGWPSGGLPDPSRSPATMGRPGLDET